RYRVLPARCRWRRIFFFSSRRRHTRFKCDWSSDVCSSDLFTRRSARLVLGVQSRDYGPRTRIRITTLEQTLLDTLSKPFHCGGRSEERRVGKECRCRWLVDAE